MPSRSTFLAAGMVFLGVARLLAADGMLAEAVQISLDRPGDREFVRDLAGMVRDADKAKIKDLGERLLTDKATPIIVVTINSMAEHGGAGMRIETFARLLFDQWGIGVEKLGDQPWNTGNLLLVSKGDRKARIELGAHWRRDQDMLCEQIMQSQIIPRFKQGDFSGGIVAGVEALDKMARGLKLPAAVGSSGPGAPSSQAPSAWRIPILIGLGLLAVFTVVSLVRSGSKGWSWLLWSAVFAGVGYLIYQMIANANHSRGSSGGGFSGGSFGGGFSGGGGSTGSW
jgi:uncharacterized protein